MKRLEDGRYKIGTTIFTKKQLIGIAIGGIIVLSIFGYAIVTGFCTIDKY